MITPSFGLTATERVLPKLALDFTTATLDARITFTRAGNTATYTNSSGVITAINANLPRFDYNPSTLICQGLLIEEARTNIVLNSLIDGTILSTQIVTTSATAYTLSFYGTGSIVLTGTHSATVTGTGVYPSRKTYTFTPTAGALTLTVSGTVQYAQLEAGSFATSFIPTSVASVTRNADVATMTGTNFSSWYNASEGTFTLTSIAGTNVGYASGAYTQRGIEVSSATNAYMTIARLNTATTARLLVVDGTIQVAIDQSNYTQNTASTFTFGYKLNNYVFAGNGAAVTTDVAATVPTCTTLNIGKATTAEGFLNGWIRKINYYPMRLTNAEVQAFSKG